MGIADALAQFILGPFGISLIILGVAGSFIGASMHIVPPRAGVISFVCGAMAFASAYIVRTYITAGA